MLTFESPFYSFEDVVIFRDHASPHTFHYLAGHPRLTRDAGGKRHLLLPSSRQTPRRRRRRAASFEG